MADKIDAYANALSDLSRAPALEDTRNGLIEKITREGLLKQVLARLLDMTASSSASPALSEKSSGDPAQFTSASMFTSLPLTAGREHEDIPLQHCSVPANPRCQIPGHPKVVIQTRRPCVGKTQRKQDGSKLLSQLQWRALTESSEESCPDTSPPSAIDPDESSGDELSYDKPRAAQPATLIPASCTPHPESIDWVFWIRSDAGIGQWRPLSGFPISTQTFFVRKFNADFLNTTDHASLYARMLRNREAYVTRDMCVGNVTHWRRNKPGKWKVAKGDKEKACDTCFKAGRFCARAVLVESVVKLGFFPVPEAVGQSVGWRELRHWAGEKMVSEQ